MAEVKITDLVDQSTIDKIKELDKEIKTLLDTYTGVAKELAKGLNVDVKVAGDIDKLETLLSSKAKEAVDTQKKLTETMQEQGKVIADTSNTISRELTEREKANKATRETYDAHVQVNSILAQVHGAYKEQVQKLIELNQALADNKKAQEENKKALKDGVISMDEFNKRQVSLISENRSLVQEKRKLNQVLTAEEKAAQSATSSYSRMSQELELMKKAYKEMSEAERKSAKGKELEKHIQDLDAHLKDLAADMGEFQRNVGNYAIAGDALAGKLSGLLGVNEKFGASIMSLTQGGNVFEKLKVVVGSFGKTLIGVVSNPWVLSFLGIAGTIAAFKWWYDYNKGIAEATRLTKEFTGLQGQDLTELRSGIQATCEVMDKDYKETLQTVDALMAHFHITGKEALEVINKGFAAGADINGDMLSKIQQNSAAFHDAGISAKEMMAIITQTRSGIFGDDGLAAINKASQQIRLMTDKTKAALKDIGINAEDLQKKLVSGEMSVFGAIQQVSAKIKEFPDDSQVVATAIKNVFGKTGLAASQEMIESLADMSTSLDEVTEKTGEYGKLLQEQMDLTTDLEKNVADLFEVQEGGWETVTMKTKNFFLSLFNSIVKWVKNGRDATRDWINNLSNVWKSWQDIVGYVIKQAQKIGGIFKDLGGIVGNALTGNIDEAKASFDRLSSTVSSFKSDLVSTFKTIGGRFKSTSSGQWEEDLSGGASGGYTVVKTTGTGTGASSPTSSKSSKSSNKDAEKAAKEELKRLQELEESKIALMADGHEKEIAQIRLNYKKKLDAIKGNGETENALRLNLALQCDKDIAAADLKYQTELSKINLANKLATVKEGSEEELTYKLAQIEASRAAEIKAAEKTGADVNLINEKFNKQRQDLEEDYAAKRAEMVEKEYADRIDAINNEHLSAVNALKNKYAEELRVTKDSTKLRAKYEKDLATLERDYAKKTAEETIEMIEKVLATDKLSAEERKKYEQELADAKIDLEGQMADAAVQGSEDAADAAGDEMDNLMKKIEYWADKAGEAIEGVSGLMSQLYQNQIDQLEDQIDANTEAGEAEQERISALVEKNVITEEEGEARKRAAEAQTAKKEEELQKKKAALEMKQAKWEKANSLAQAAISTALAIMRLWVSPGWPAAIPMAAVVGALGAVQMATIAATPLPQYAKGTDYHKGGPAVVGDGGRQEVVLYNGSAWLTPDTPTVIDLPKGASVIPSVDQLINQTALATLPSTMSAMPKSYNDAAMRRDVAEIASLIRRQTARQHADAFMREYNNYKRNVL